MFVFLHFASHCWCGGCESVLSFNVELQYFCGSSSWRFYFQTWGPPPYAGRKFYFIGNLVMMLPLNTQYISFLFGVCSKQICCASPTRKTGLETKETLASWLNKLLDRMKVRIRDSKIKDVQCNVRKFPRNLLDSCLASQCAPRASTR